MPGAGIEPALPFGNRILSPKRLPFRHPGELRLKAFANASGKASLRYMDCELPRPRFLIA
jgi:hypothetical protein